jgi:hypothetical protein
MHYGYREFYLKREVAGYVSGIVKTGTLHATMAGKGKLTNEFMSD